MKKFSKAIAVLAISVLPFIQGCIGSIANPVSSFQLGDESIPCRSIVREIHQNEDKVRKLLPKSNKTGKNVAVGIIGAVIFWPALFFMDFSDDEKVEIQAFQRRNERLTYLYDKKCSKK